MKAKKDFNYNEMQSFEMILPKGASNCLVQMAWLTSRKAAGHRGPPSMPFVGLFAA